MTLVATSKKDCVWARLLIVSAVTSASMIDDQKTRHDGEDSFFEVLQARNELKSCKSTSTTTVKFSFKAPCSGWSSEGAVGACCCCCLVCVCVALDIALFLFFLSLSRTAAAAAVLWIWVYCFCLGRWGGGGRAGKGSGG